MTDLETAHAYRGIVTRAVVRSSNDNGATQTATVTTARHVDRSDVEILAPFGFASNPGAGGSVVVLAVGGDQGDLVALPLANRSQRLGKLKKGESAQYGADGTRVHIKEDGTVHIPAREGAKIEAGPFTFEISKGGDRLVCRRGTGANAMRFVIRPTYVKMRAAAEFVIVNETGIIVSSAPVVGPDPEPSV